MDPRKLLDPTEWEWPRARFPRLFRRMSHPYRMVFIDERTLEEGASYRLTRHGVYALLTSAAVIGTAVLLALILLTPLKYYIPGYGSGEVRTRSLRMQQTVDSLSRVVAAQEQRTSAIQKLLAGELPVLDTAQLDVEKLERERMQSVVPQAEEVKKAVR